MSRYSSDLFLLKLMSAAGREAQWREDRYAANVREWYTEGDGRSPQWVTRLTPDGEDVYRVNVGGKGYRYPRCIHGANLCVDHDIPCGTCEGGVSLREIYLADAANDYAEFKRRTDAIKALTDMGYARDGVDTDAMKPLREWAWEPVAYGWDQAVAQMHERQIRMAAWRAAFTDPEPMPPSFEDREAQAHYDDTWR